MKNKQIIRLTESDLHRIIKESVNRIISERIAGEEGMTDDEVMRRRNDNFMKDMDSYPNNIWHDPFEPNYSDRIEMEAPYHSPEEMDYRVAHDRMMHHKRAQRHNKPMAGI